MKLSTIDKLTINVMVETGFTFLGDSHFHSFKSARVCLIRLERHGYAIKEGSSYTPTGKSRDFIIYGIEE